MREPRRTCFFCDFPYHFQLRIVQVLVGLLVVAHVAVCQKQAEGQEAADRQEQPPQDELDALRFAND
jgi:hypothetical protein